MTWKSLLPALVAGSIAAAPASAQQECPADLDGDGLATANDIALFFDKPFDLNGDGLINVFDFDEYLRLWARGCTPVAIAPPQPDVGEPGEMVKIPFANLPAGVNPNDFCVIQMGGAGFRVRGIVPGDLPGEQCLMAELLPGDPDAQPGPIMVQLGEGNKLQPPPLPGVGVPPKGEPWWFWLGNPDPDPVFEGPFEVPVDFTPLPGDDPDTKFKGTFFLDGGRLCLDIPSDDQIDWQRCDEISLQFRAWCDLRRPDVNIPRLILCDEDPTARDVANAICDAIRAAFAASGITINCEVLNLGADGFRICLSYPDCEIDGPTWQFEGNNPFAFACVTGPAPDCEEICDQPRPDIVDVVDQGDGIICIFANPDFLDPEEDPKNLCIRHDQGIILEAQDVAFDPDRGLTKVTARVRQVPADAQGVEGRIMITVGTGECPDLPDPFPGVCQAEPGFRWIPLGDFPMLAGGEIAPTPGAAEQKFLERFTLENGRQCLVIPRNFTLKPCDSVSIFIRLWCQSIGRTPDINIPRIIACEELNAEQFAELLCRAIEDAFLTGSANVPAIPQIVCDVTQQANGDWKVSIGYTDCLSDGPVAANGTLWSQVGVTNDDPLCDQKCPDVPKPEIVGIQGGNNPGELVFVQVRNFPQDIQGADVCFSAEGGQLFQPEFFEAFNDGQGGGELAVRVLPQGQGVQAGQIRFKIGRGEFFDQLKLNPDLPVEIQGRPWVWQGDPQDPDCPGPGWVPGGGEACPGEDSRFWTLNENTGELCLEITEGVPADCKVSVFLRAYCDIRQPDVHIEDICALRDLSARELAEAICEVIRAAYMAAGIPIDCRVDISADGFPEIKISYPDCDINGPFFGPDGRNPSSITFCCPPDVPAIKTVDNPFALPGEIVCLEVCNVPAGKGPDDWCVATIGGQLFQVLQQEDLGGGRAKLFALVLPSGFVQPGPLMIKCGQGQRVDLPPDLPFPVQPFPLRPGLDPRPWIWQPNDPDAPEGDGPMWEAAGGGQKSLFCEAGGPAPTKWTFDGMGRLCLIVDEALDPGEFVSIFLRAYCDARRPDVTIPGIKNTGTAPIPPGDLADIICQTITTAYQAAGIPEIVCNVTQNPTGPGFKITLGYSDCSVDGPTWGPGGANPSTFQICPCP